MRQERLQPLLQNWKTGALATQGWLQKQGIYKQLTHKFIKSGWIESVGFGAYKKVGDDVSWQGGVYALQQEAPNSIHVGGLTALELLDQAHFLPLGKSKLHLFNTKDRDPRRLLPKWFVEYFSTIDISFHRYRLFVDPLALHEYDCHNFKIWISTPERALFEVCSLVPNMASLDHAFLLISGKYNLRVDLLQHLLANCTSYKTKRLFLYLAKRAGIPSFTKLELAAVNLGTGKRVIAEGGTYDPEFKLELPNITTDDQNIKVEF